MIKLYSTDCPKCKVIETKLSQCGIQYEKVTDIEAMKKLGITSAPQLDIEGALYGFNEAIKYIKEFECEQRKIRH